MIRKPIDPYYTCIQVTAMIKQPDKLDLPKQPHILEQLHLFIKLQLDEERQRQAFLNQLVSLTVLVKLAIDG